MQHYEPLEREPHTRYRVFLIEKLIINFALPSDLIFHTWRAYKEKDRSQTTPQRIVAMWKGKVVKYQKLLRVKDENGGVIPEDYKELCRLTPCGKARLYLADLPWRNPNRARRHTSTPVNAGPPASASSPGHTAKETYAGSE